VGVRLAPPLPACDLDRAAPSGPRGGLGRRCFLFFVLDGDFF
jgi:hypothetical protein